MCPGGTSVILLVVIGLKGAHGADRVCFYRYIYPGSSLTLNPNPTLKP